jgi:DNA-binding NtrC family response regulator
MSEQIKILIVEDNAGDTELVVRELYRAGFDAHWLRVDTEADYLANLSPDLDLILSDCDMPQFGSLRALELLKQRRLEIPFIIVSGDTGVETAVKTMEQGATDYLLKERISRLGPVVHRAMKKIPGYAGRMRPEQELTDGTENL